MRIVCGRAGSGKTEFILSEVVRLVEQEPHRIASRLIVIVPDQTAFSLESRLTRMATGGALVRAEVQSFRRLAWRAREWSAGSARAVIRDAGKASLLAAAFADVSPRLRVLGRNQPSRAYFERVARFVEECQMYGMDERGLGEAAQDPGLPLLAAHKLHDAGVILGRYRELIGERFIDPYDLLPMLARQAAQLPWLAAARVYVDGFLGFTAQELLVLAALHRHASHLSVSLSAPSAALQGAARNGVDERGPFARIEDGFVRLSRAASVAARDIEWVDRDGGVPGRFVRAPLIAHAERHLFSLRRAPFADLHASPLQDEVRVTACASRRAEAEFAAASLWRLHRDRGLRWSDMLVVTSDREAYAPLLAEALEDAAIPFFMDVRRTLVEHPLAVLVTSALAAAAAPHDDAPLWRMLRTDLTPLASHVVDALENRCLEQGVALGASLAARRGRAHRPVGRTSDRVMALLGSLLGPFFNLLCDAGPLSAQDVARAVWELLARLRVERRILAMADRAREAGDGLAAQLHERAFESTVGVLDELVAAFSTRPVTASEAATFFTRSYEGIRMGVIPAELNQVVVTEVARLRASESEAVILLGCSDGLFPRRAKEDDMLSDRERAALLGCGLELAPGAVARHAFLRSDAYVALTRARRHLMLTYPLADERGRALAPSSLIPQLHRLLGDRVALDTFSGRAQNAPGDISLCTTPRRTAEHLAGVLRDAQSAEQVAPLWRAVYSLFAEGRWASADARGALAGLAHRVGSEPLPGDVARRLYGTEMNGSVSRLERAAACEFMHFADYGLRLRQRRLPVVDPALRGDLVHLALRSFVEGLRAGDLEWRQAADAQLRELLDATLDDVFASFRDGLLLKSARTRLVAGQLRRQLSRAVAVLTEHARRSAFAPVAVELAFGGDGDSLPPLLLRLSSGAAMRLRGRIDRVDAAAGDGARRFRVIDYKTGDRRLELDKSYHGLSLQLVLYAEVVRRHSGRIMGEPHEFAGIFYFPVRDWITAVGGPTDAREAERAARKVQRMRGLAIRDARLVPLLDCQAADGADDLFPKLLKKNGDFQKSAPVAAPAQWAALAAHVHGQAVRLGERIQAGGTAIAPYRMGQEIACERCPHAAVCQIDPAGGLGGYRTLPRLSAEQVWQELGFFAGGQEDGQ